MLNPVKQGDLSKFITQENIEDLNNEERLSKRLSRLGICSRW